MDAKGPYGAAWDRMGPWARTPPDLAGQARAPPDDVNIFQNIDF